jgi:hypothetical protein
MKRFLNILLVVVMLSFSASSFAATSLIFNDNGAADELTAWLNNTWPSGGKNFVLHLYCTNVTPADTDVASTYTECSGGGYSAITLTNGSWTVSSVGSIYQAAYAKQTWTFTGTLTTNGTIYGYYITDQASTPVVVWSQLFNAPMTPANNGDQLSITPVLQASHGTPSS